MNTSRSLRWIIALALVLTASVASAYDPATNVTPGTYGAVTVTGTGQVTAGTVVTPVANGGTGSATVAGSPFDAAGAATTAQNNSLQKTSNLSDLSTPATARTNLGLGTAATANTTAFDAAGAATAAQNASQPLNIPIPSVVVIVSSGTTNTAAANNTVIWKSTTAAAKAQTIPAAAAANSGLDIVIKDAAMTAGSYNIVITPTSGTVEGASSLAINIGGQSVTLRSDGSSNWIII